MGNEKAKAIRIVDNAKINELEQVLRDELEKLDWPIERLGHIRQQQIGVVEHVKTMLVLARSRVYEDVQAAARCWRDLGERELSDELAYLGYQLLIEGVELTLEQMKSRKDLQRRCNNELRNQPLHRRLSGPDWDGIHKRLGEKEAEYPAEVAAIREMRLRANQSWEHGRIVDASRMEDEIFVLLRKLFDEMVSGRNINPVPVTDNPEAPSVGWSVFSPDEQEVLDKKGSLTANQFDELKVGRGKRWTAKGFSRESPKDWKRGDTQAVYDVARKRDRQNARNRKTSG